MREEPDEPREGECGGMSPGSWRAVSRVVNTVRSYGERRHPLRPEDESPGGSKPTWTEPLFQHTLQLLRRTPVVKPPRQRQCVLSNLTPKVRIL